MRRRGLAVDAVVGATDTYAGFAGDDAHVEFLGCPCRHTGCKGCAAPYLGSHVVAKRLADRARAFAASTSRFLGGAVETRSANRCCVA